MIIGGAEVGAGSRLAVCNPATGEVFGSVPDGDLAAIGRAVAAARVASRGWRTDEGARRRLLLECGNAVAREAAHLAALLTREQGKPLAEARAEVDLAASWFHSVADLPLPVEVLQNGQTSVEVRREPYGVVAAITPWNYPVILAVCKMAPALLAGNTVVLKPSPYAPLTPLAMVRILADVLPAGVLNAVTGGDSIGPALVSWPGIDIVSFTGSVPVGKEIAAATGSRLRKTILELGGNDAAIVLAGANVTEIVEPLFRAAFANAGQFCVAIKRLYVHRSLAADVVEGLAAAAAAAVVGDGLDPKTTMGPVTRREQLERVIGLVADARARGALVIHGGERLPWRGNFMRPTIVTGVDDEAGLVANEQFGPALPVLVYDDIEDAIVRANDTTFGLGGSVWGPPDQAQAYAARLECGTSWVNAHAAFHPLAPFGGHKWSGMGYEYGPAGLAEFLRYRVLHQPSREPIDISGGMDVS